MTILHHHEQAATTTDAPPFTLNIHTTFKGKPCVASLIACHLDSGKTFAKGTDGGGFASILVPAPGPQGLTVAISGAKNSFYILTDGSLQWADENGVTNLQRPGPGQYEFTFEAIPNPFKAAVVAPRAGIVRVDGRTWRDDAGAYWPLGCSLFWAVRGLREDPDKLWANVQFAADHGVQYLRCFMHCLWVDAAIDSTWPDFVDLARTLMDRCHDEYGIRIGWTLYGGGAVDFDVLTETAIEVIQGRESLVQSVEMANEAWSIGVPLETLNRMITQLAPAVPNVCARSSPGTNQTADQLSAPPALWLPHHLSRSANYDGWQNVRQPWDPWYGYPMPMNHDEPIGPDSSVAWETDPLRQVSLRVCGILCGMGAYTYHSGAGVYGKSSADPHGRPDNLADEPNAAAILDALRGVDLWLPANINQGRYFNSQWDGSPWMPTTYWPDNGETGPNRLYICDHGDGTVTGFALGITGHSEIRNRYNVELDLIDPILGPVEHRSLSAGETFYLDPHSRDNMGHGALILQGTYR